MLHIKVHDLQYAPELHRHFNPVILRADLYKCDLDCNGTNKYKTTR